MQSSKVSHAHNVSDSSGLGQAHTGANLGRLQSYPHEMAGDAGLALGRPLAEMQNLIGEYSACENQPRTLGALGCLVRDFTVQPCAEIPEVGALPLHVVVPVHAMIRFVRVSLQNRHLFLDLGAQSCSSLVVTFLRGKAFLKIGGKGWNETTVVVSTGIDYSESSRPAEEVVGGWSLFHTDNGLGLLPRPLLAVMHGI